MLHMLVIVKFVVYILLIEPAVQQAPCTLSEHIDEFHILKDLVLFLFEFCKVKRVSQAFS